MPDAVAQQLDFSLGEFQSGALEREPDGAAETIVGLLGSDGLPYRRGGSTYKSNAAFGSAGLMWVFDGVFQGGRRTIFTTPYDGVRSIAVLDVDDQTPVNMSDTPTRVGTGAASDHPQRPAYVRSMLGWVFHSGVPILYGGSRKPKYTTGTVTVTNGGHTVTGAGTSWAANLDAGMFLTVATDRAVLIESVDSDTQVTLVDAYPYPSLAGAAYVVSPSAVVAAPAGILFGDASSRCASIAGRLLITRKNKLYFSPSEGPLKQWSADDFHSFEADPFAMGVLRDVLLVFTAAGVYAVSGMAYPLVDPGSGDPLQRKELVNADVIAWAHEGIASWANALVVPALDGVYLMDAVGAPQRISDRIEDLYLSYVRAGYVPGVAEVYNGHYFLPILNGTTWIDTLVCRLQPSHSGNNFAWTQLAGSGAEVAAFAERQTVPPLLLAASRRTTSRVLDCSAFFKPAVAVKNDADGTTPGFTLTTIDYPTGNMVSNFVHHVRLMYGLTDAAADNPTISAEVSIDSGAFTALSGTAPTAQPGEKKWRVNKHAKNVRFRFTVTAASALCWVKSVEVFVRHSGRQ